MPLSDNAALKTRLVEDYNTGEDLDKLATERGISVGTLYALIRNEPGRITRQQRLDLIRRREGLQLAKYYNAGYSLRRLKKITGRSYGGIRNLLQFVGVTLRSPEQAASVRRMAAEQSPQHRPSLKKRSTDQSMAEHVRMSGRHLETPIRCYVHPDSGRRIWLVGTVHFGLPGYYEDIKAAITQIVEAGAVVHHEYTALVETMNNLPPDVTQQERDVLDATVESGKLSGRVVCRGGWVDQVTGLGGWPEGWQRVDLNHLEVIRLAGPEVMLNSLRASTATLEFALTSKLRRKHYVVTQWLAIRMAADGVKLPEAPTDDVVVHRRNEVALEGVDSTDRDLVLVWGGDHLPGLAEGLDKRGFALEYQTWHVVGRMPSYWWLPLVTAIGIFRNLRRLPSSVRYARKTVMVSKTKEPSGCGANGAPDAGR